MTASASPFIKKKTHGARLLVLVLFVAVVGIYQSSHSRCEGTPVVFELELPDFQLPPSSQREINIPSSNVSQVFIYILKPVADSIDYNNIRTSINGQASATISEAVNGVRGKLIKINLGLRPGFVFSNGRNTVEV